VKKSFTSKEKAKIALVALTERDTISAIASAHGAHPTQVGLWKKKTKEELYTVFDTTHSESKPGILRLRRNRLEEQAVAEIYGVYIFRNDADDQCSFFGFNANQKKIRQLKSVLQSRGYTVDMVSAEGTSVQ